MGMVIQEVIGLKMERKIIEIRFIYLLLTLLLFSCEDVKESMRTANNCSPYIFASTDKLNNSYSVNVTPLLSYAEVDLNSRFIINPTVSREGILQLEISVSMYKLLIKEQCKIVFKFKDDKIVNFVADNTHTINKISSKVLVILEQGQNEKLQMLMEKRVEEIVVYTNDNELISYRLKPDEEEYFVSTLSCLDKPFFRNYYKKYGKSSWIL